MIDPKEINAFFHEVVDALPPGLKNMPSEAKANFKSCVQSALQKLDMVSREEFDAQAAVLARTRKKLTALEKKIAELEGSKKK